MTKLRIDELDFELSEPAAIAVTAKFKKDAMSLEELSASVNALQAEIEKLKGEKTAMGMEMDACKTEMEKVKADAESNKMDSAKIHEAAMARVSLIKAAEKAVPTLKLDSLSDKEIKVEVIKSRNAEFKADGLSDAFIDGMFTALNTIQSRVDSLGSAINSTKGVKTDSTDARIKSMESDRNAWKS